LITRRGERPAQQKSHPKNFLNPGFCKEGVELRKIMLGK